jgi:hypothetical protein
MSNDEKKRILYKVYSHLYEREWQVNLNSYRVIYLEYIDECVDNYSYKLNKKAKKMGINHKRKPRIK